MRRAMTIVGTLFLAFAVAIVPAMSAQPSRLQITIATGTAPARPDGMLSYLIRVHNPGRTTITDTTLTARIAFAAEIVGITAPHCAEPSHGRVTCALPPLPAGGTAKIAIITVVRPGARGRLRTSAVVGGARAAAVTPVRPGTDLAVRLRPVRRNTVVATVANKGPRTAHGVTLLAAATESRLVRQRGARCRRDGRSLRCPLGGLAPGARRRLWFSTLGGPVAATVEPEVGDPHPADNTALSR